MQWFRRKIYLKTLAAVLLLAIVCVIVARLGYKQVLVSNILFMVGLFGVCISIVDILLKAHLLAGWFRHRKKGETDEEYQKNKINVRKVGSLKNAPIRSSKFGSSCLAAGCIFIFCAVLATL